VVLWVGSYVAAAAVFVLAVVHTNRWPDPVTVVLFSTLLVWAESSAAMLPTTRVSPRFMVVMASIAAFHGRGVVLGATITGVCGGVALYQLRQRRFRVLFFNCAQSLLSAAAAAICFDLLRTGPAGPVVGVVVAGLAYAVVNVGLVLPASVIDSGASAGEVWADMAPALPNYLAFGLLGTLIGQLYEQLGPFALVLLITPVAIGRAAFSAYLEVQQAHEAPIKVLLRAIEAKDPYTAGHTQRVARFSGFIGEKLGFSHARQQHLRQAALVHDVGKLAVPRHLLTKPSKLTADEFQQVQRHVSVCVDILSRVDFLRPMAAAAAGHHTRYDGGGYGVGGALPLEASIVAVADAFDAMTSTRAYRKALAQEVAFAELRAQSGTQLHPECVEALIAALEERGERYGAGHEVDLVDYEVTPPEAGPGSAGLGDLVRTPRAARA
jgi:hypothetical protein